MPKKRKIRYFYLNGHLHKVLHVNRAKDLVNAWDYTDHRRKLYPWSATRKMMQNAYGVSEVARLVGRDKTRIYTYMYGGMIKVPQRTYNLETREPGAYYFSEDDVLDVHTFLSEVHYGRPRKDGMATPLRLLSRAELKTLLQSETMLYTKDDNGEFIPVWKEQVW